MQLLLVAQKQIPARKASCALWALERLLFCVRSFMALQMLQSGK
jgi:hypothetical protein